MRLKIRTVGMKVPVKNNTLQHNRGDNEVEVGMKVALKNNTLQRNRGDNEVEDIQ